MAKAQLQCPSCGGAVELGQVTCPHCGVNLRSGESFTKRVKRARGRRVNPERTVPGLYVGAVLAFGLLVFSGFMFQRKMETTISKRPELFAEPIATLQWVEDLVAVGDYATAREEMASLIKALEEQRMSLDVPVYQTRHHYWSSRSWSAWEANEQIEENYSKRVALLMLSNLKAKAERRLASIPSGPNTALNPTQQGEQSSE